MISTFFLNLIFLLNLFLITKSEDYLTVENLLQWSQKNGIKISPKIKISFDKGVNVTAIEDIPQKEELISFPEKMILNIDKILDLINSPELKTQYENFKKLEMESYKPRNDEIHKEEIFLAYIFYLMKNEEEKYKNTEFYKTFKELILSIEKFNPNSPLLYTNEQKQYISGTYFGLFSQEIRKTINKEIDIFKNASYYNKNIDANDYIQKRLFVFNRGYDTTKKELGEIIIAPIYTLFPFDNIGSNARIDIKYGEGAKILSTYSIKKGSQITVYSHSKNNVEKFVFEGRMNNYLTTYKENYLIPTYSPYFYYKYDIDDIKLLESHYFNIFDNFFEKKARDYYKEHADIFKVKEATELWACYMVQENLEYYKNFVENLTKRVDEIFKGENEEKIYQLNRALKGEWLNLNKKYERIVELCGYEKKRDIESRTEDL